MGFSEHNDSRPLLITFCGLPGSGKTTTAKKLELETDAVRLNTDEWMADLSIDLFDEAMRDKLQARLYKFGRTLLQHGQNIIVEDGHWSRKERDWHREDAHRLGVFIELHYFDLSFDEIWKRLDGRNATGGHGTVPITKEQLQDYWSMFERPDTAELELFDRYVVHT